MALPPLLQDALRLPVIGAPLFIVSNPELTLAQCTAGIVGSFPALNARPPELLDQWLTQITAELAAYKAAHPQAKVAPFAVNQIVHSSNDRLQHDLDLCVKHRVPILITSLRAPDAVVEAAHSYGGLVFHDVTNIKHAQRALAAGVDLAYIGTGFIASREANAADAYKQMIVDSRGEDIVYSNLFTGVHGNYLRGSIVAAGLDPDALPESDKNAMNFGSGRSKAWRDIWGAGQGVGQIRDVQPAAAIVEQLEREYRSVRARLGLAHERSCVENA